jgi:hypothetical protein
MDDLPPPNTMRWVARRKAAVVAAVRSGKITMEEALRRYQLSKRSSSPGSVRSRRTALPVCVSRAFSNTAGRVHRPAPDRDADFHRFLAQRPGYVTEEQQAPAARRDFSFSHRYRSLENAARVLGAWRTRLCRRAM